MATDELLSLLSTSAIYMSSLPASFQEMADVLLVVEGDLPAHKAVLAANSTVLADLLTSLATAASRLKAGLPEIPMLGESLQDATTALTNLIPKVRERDYNGEYVMRTTNQAVVSWTALADECGLSKLLAHCEDFMIRDDDKTLWHDEALSHQLLNLQGVMYHVRLYKHTY